MLKTGLQTRIPALCDASWYQAEFSDHLCCFYIGLLPDRLIERLLESRDVIPLLEDQEELLHPGSSDGEDPRFYILVVHFGLHGLQDLGVGLTVLRRHPDSVARPSGRRVLRHLSLTFKILRRGPIPHSSVGSGLRWPQRKRAMYCPSLSWKSDPQGGGGSNPLLTLCQLFWGISQRRRARSPKYTHLFRGRARSKQHRLRYLCLIRTTRSRSRRGWILIPHDTPPRQSQAHTSLSSSWAGEGTTRRRSVGLFLVTNCGGFAVSLRRFHTPIRSEPHSRESPFIGSSLTFKDIYHSHAALSFIQSTHSSQALTDPFSAPLPGAYILLHAWGQTRLQRPSLSTCDRSVYRAPFTHWEDARLQDPLHLFTDSLGHYNLHGPRTVC